MTAPASAIMHAPANLADEPVTCTPAGDDIECARQAQAGSLDAFSKLVARYQAGVFNYIFRRLNSRCDAEDLTQETFVRAWTSIGTYNPRWRISTWLYAIATRLTIDHARAQRSRQNAKLHDLAQPAQADPAQPVLEREARSHLWDVAHRLLGEDERAALWLKYAENFSSDEIARTLGRSSIAVRVMLFRARKLLAGALEGVETNDGEDAMTRGTKP